MEQQSVCLLHEFPQKSENCLTNPAFSDKIFPVARDSRRLIAVMVRPSCRGFARNYMRFLCPHVFWREDIYFSEVTFIAQFAKVLESKKAIVDALADEAAEFHRCRFRGLQGHHRRTGYRAAQSSSVRPVWSTPLLRTRSPALPPTRPATPSSTSCSTAPLPWPYTTGDPIAPARIICEFAKKNKNVHQDQGRLG